MIRAKNKSSVYFIGVKVPKFNVILIKQINTVFIENIAFLQFFLTKNKYVDYIVKKFFFFRKKSFSKVASTFFFDIERNPQKFAAL